MEASGGGDPASLSGSLQVPCAALDDEHVFGAVQPLPSRPRHPSTHRLVRESQMRPLVVPPQSASFLHSPQRPVVAHTSLRQTSALVHASPVGRPHFTSRWKHTALRQTAAFVVGPHDSPLGSPQRSSAAKHDAETHTRWPFCGVHSPATGATFGSGSPFGAFGVHDPAAHHSVVRQSASTAQTAPHEPVARLQIAPARPAQSAFDAQRPHAPPVVQSGSVEVGHAFVPVAPKSALHVSQTLPLVHTGLLPPHCVYDAHSAQRPAFAPATMQVGSVARGQAREAPTP